MATMNEKELVQKIKEIPSWDWYLDQKPKMLSEELRERFDIKVGPAKLRSLKKSIENTPETQESQFIQ